MTFLTILHDQVEPLKKGLAGFEHTTSRDSFSDVVIRSLCFVCTNVRVPATLLISGGVYATLCKHMSSMLLPCKQPASLPLLCNWAQSPLLRAWFMSLASPYSNQLFSHRFWKKYLIYLPRGRFCVRSKGLYAQIKQLYARFK